MSADNTLPTSATVSARSQEAFHCNVNAVVSDDLRIFLDGLALAPRGFNNTLGSLRTFFAFAQDRGWLSKEADLLAGIEKRREMSVPVEIFYPSRNGRIARAVLR
ncbi:MAG: hypothetical protein WDN28_30435 [Chthoniobacter sp.]